MERDSVEIEIMESIQTVWTRYLSENHGFRYFKRLAAGAITTQQVPEDKSPPVDLYLLPIAGLASYLSLSSSLQG